MMLVEKCVNWTRISEVRGRNCYNCAFRNGYPDRGQPSRACLNFVRVALREELDRIDGKQEETK